MARRANVTPFCLVLARIFASGEKRGPNRML